MFFGIQVAKNGEAVKEARGKFASTLFVMDNNTRGRVRVWRRVGLVLHQGRVSPDWLRASL